MRKIFGVILLSMGLYLPSEASRSLNESQEIAERLLSSKVRCMQVGVSNGDTAYYFFKGENQGYAVISADPRTEEVLAYSEKARLQADTVPSPLKGWLDHFAQSLSVKPASELRLVQPSSEGTALRASKITGHEVAPLLGDMCWGQREPFNDLCPVDNGEHSPAGCRCVSMAQVMNFYQYPPTLPTDIPSYRTATLGITIPGVKKGTPIDWNNIVDDYSGFRATSEQKEAAAQLVSMVGTATVTDYTSGGSGSTCNSALVMCDYFGYDRDLIRLYMRESFSLTEWNDLLVSELEAGRPVLYEGISMGGGHGFVIDGLDKMGKFHVNWGWYGDYDGYYDITLMAPPCNDGVGASSTDDGYNQRNKVVAHMVPDNGVKDSSQDPSLCAIGLEYQTNEAGNHYLFFEYGTTRAYDLNCYAGCGYQDAGGYVFVVDRFTSSRKSFPAGEYYTQTNAHALNPNAFAWDGIYRLSLVESTDGVNWRLSQGANSVFKTFERRDGKLYLVEDDCRLDANLIVKDFDEKHPVGEVECDLHLTNKGNKEYYNKIYFMQSSEPVNPMRYTFASGITLEANGGDNDLEFAFTPKSDTIYYWVMDAEMNLIKEGFVARDRNDGVENLIDSDELSVTVETETLCVTSVRGGTLKILSIDGKSIYHGDLRPGDPILLRMSPGLYLVNGRKIIIP